MITIRSLPPAITVLAALAGFAAASVATAGVVIEDKPVSLLTKNLVMRNGKAYLPGADLARALGGTARWDSGTLRYEIRPGANGLLKLNSGALSALAAAKLGRASARREDPESGTGGLGSRRLQASQNAVKLNLGGGDLMIEEDEHILLRPGELGFSLELIGRLLGGQARFDAARGGWLLPGGGPNSALSFR